MDDVLPLDPAITEITKHLDVCSLKSLSRVSKSWWEATHDALSKRCSVVVDRRAPSVFPMRSYERAKIIGDENWEYIPLKVKELRISAATQVKPSDLKQFSKLNKLILHNTCLVKGSEFTGIKSLQITRDYVFPGIRSQFEKFHKSTTSCCFDLQGVVFENLKYLTVTFMSLDVGCLHLDGFIERHTLLQQLVLDVSTPHIELFKMLPKCTEMHTLTIYGDVMMEVFEHINAMPSLRMLVLNNITPHKLAKLNLQNICDLKCAFRYTDDCTTNTDWLTPSTNMHTMELSYINNNELSLKSLAKKYPNLRAFEISTRSPCHITDAGVFPNLTKLEWSVQSNVQFNIQNIIAPKLKSLTLQKSLFNARAIGHFSKHSPHLEHLDYYPSYMSKESCVAMDLVEAFPHLKTLDIWAHSNQIHNFFAFYTRYFNKFGQGFPLCTYCFLTC